MLTNIRKITNIDRLVATNRLNLRECSSSSSNVGIVATSTKRNIRGSFCSNDSIVIICTVVTVKISVATTVGFPIGLTHNAFVFWLVLQLAEILPLT